MKLNFIKVNPSENMTIFIENEVPKQDYVKISKKLMDYSNICAEQVGFIEINNDETIQYDARLEMMGGEFCGNATRSLGAVVVHNGRDSVYRQGGKHTVNLKVSGSAQIVKCEVEKTEVEHIYISQIYMPLHKSRPQELEFEIDNKKIVLEKIDFQGISHFIVDYKNVDVVERLLDVIKKYMEDVDYDAFGIMFYDFEKRYLKPLVYVKSTDSLFWERSCGSGSCALGVSISYGKNKEVDITIKQPGGDLQVITEFENGEVVSIKLRGNVDIVAKGVVNI